MALAESGISALKQFLGERNVLTNQEDLIPYSFDGTAALQQMPGCVVFAESPERVALILKYAGENGIPVVTRGSGTGLSGGSLPVPECIVLCLAKMDKILERHRTMHSGTGRHRSV